MVSSLLDLGPQFLGELKAWFEKEGFVKKPINIPFLVGYPGDSTKELRGDGTWATAGGVTYRKTTAKTVNTTTTATDLLNGEVTIAASAMGTTGVARLTAYGEWLQNSGGAAAPPRIQLVFGGTTVIDTGTGGTFTGSALRGGWRIVVEILNTATSAQVASFQMVITAQNVPGAATQVSFTTGSGVYQTIASSGALTGASAVAQGVGTSAVDTTAAKALVLNTINGSASATYETKLLGALVEII